MAAVRRWYEDPDFQDYDHTPTFVTAISFTIAGLQSGAGRGRS